MALRVLGNELARRITTEIILLQNISIHTSCTCIYSRDCLASTLAPLVGRISLLTDVCMHSDSDQSKFSVH